MNPTAYDEGESAGATRRVLIGPDDGAANFAVRYFEIPPGGRSSHDRHAHDHGVYILNGTARLTLGPDVHNLGPGDVIYIAPFETHQFENTGDGTLGFLCIAPPHEPSQ